MPAYTLSQGFQGRQEGKAWTLKIWFQLTHNLSLGKKAAVFVLIQTYQMLIFIVLQVVVVLWETVCSTDPAPQKWLWRLLCKVPNTGTKERNTKKQTRWHTRETDYSPITISEKLEPKQIAQTVTWFAAIILRQCSCLSLRLATSSVAQREKSWDMMAQKFIQIPWIRKNTFCLKRDTDAEEDADWSVWY